MAEHDITLNVEMHCGGCSNAIDRVVKKVPGVITHSISLETQTVKITTDNTVTYPMILEKIKKTGKVVISGEMDGVAQAV